MEAVDRGFAARGVVLSQLSLSRETFDTDAKLAGWYESLLGQLSSTPGVEAATLASAPPLVGAGDTAVHPEGHAPASDAERRFAQLRYVDGQYFRALGMRVLSGRTFTPEDRMGAPPVVVISETMARQFFQETNPIGQRLVIDGAPPTAAEIVGIVADARLFGQMTDAPSTMYLTSRQSPRPTTHVVLKVANPSIAGPMLQAIVRSLDRTVAVGRVQSLDTLLAESLSQPRFRTVLAVLFAVLALSLTLGGVLRLSFMGGDPAQARIRHSFGRRGATASAPCNGRPPGNPGRQPWRRARPRWSRHRRAAAARSAVRTPARSNRSSLSE